jgi:hypothetical protein
MKKGIKMRQVWYVMGENGKDSKSGKSNKSDNYFPTFFDSKGAAERYAQILFPDEDTSKRYGRIYSREVLTMSDLNGG